MVKSIQAEIRDNELPANRAAALVTKLAALLGNVGDEIRSAEMSFNYVYATLLASDGTAARAKVQAQTSPEYLRLREAKDTRELVEQLIGSLKYLIRVAESEMRLSR
jgi:hypothetical protein